MKLDLLYELSCPKPWTEEKERQVYWDALDQIVLADEVGFGTVWEVEHHFLSEFSHSSAPEVFLSAVAQRTQRIRIGDRNNQAIRVRGDCGVNELRHRNHIKRVGGLIFDLDPHIDCSLIDTVLYNRPEGV